MGAMRSKRTMIWSLWLLCPIVLADDSHNFHPCFVMFMTPGAVKCSISLGGASHDSANHPQSDTLLMKGGRHTDSDCFRTVYGDSGEHCLNTQLFTLLFLCWYDREPAIVE
ncbi:hypothetical protein MTO96_031959, partial [Rhipicephalus appendiculatus]